ncbi:MAG: GNAT family N-acetyltransferase [Chloroflexi bacterium]|nr:GNAT family N-acetyltransferase [Chloroflexota bacterium]
MKQFIQPLTEAHIRAFIGWQYDEPYALYNMNQENEAEQIAFFSDPANGYFAIVAETGDLLGFCNFGADAQVPGGDYTAEAIDIGIGMRPDLTGKGRGAEYAGAVFEFAIQQFPNNPLRATIAAFNKRAQKVCMQHGFQVVDKFERPGDERPFLIMMREVA